jgi:predicted dehydrogenase
MKAIRTAIVGYGRSGRNIHTHLLRQLPDLYQIVAYVESDRSGAHDQGGDEHRRRKPDRELA